MSDPLSLAPPDATVTTADDPHRCWECGFYSFKSFAGAEDNSGKCFRDKNAMNKIYYVEATMTCPGFVAEPQEPKP